jgi:hypothetical protein
MGEWGPWTQVPSVVISTREQIQLAARERNYLAAKLSKA